MYSKQKAARAKRKRRSDSLKGKRTFMGRLDDADGLKAYMKKVEALLRSSYGDHDLGREKARRIMALRETASLCQGWYASRIPTWMVACEMTRRHGNHV